MLTTAHCLVPGLPTYIFAKLPYLDYTKLLFPIDPLSWNSEGQVILTRKAKVHDKYDRRQYDYDVGIAFLDEDIVFDGEKVD